MESSDVASLQSIHAPLTLQLNQKSNRCSICCGRYTNRKGSKTRCIIKTSWKACIQILVHGIFSSLKCLLWHKAVCWREKCFNHFHNEKHCKIFSSWKPLVYCLFPYQAVTSRKQKIHDWTSRNGLLSRGPGLLIAANLFWTLVMIDCS